MNRRASGVRWGRRLDDVLSEVNFLLVQLQVLSEATGPHKPRDIAVKLVDLHRRLDEFECRLRVQAAQMGESDGGTLDELRRRLATLAEQHPHYTGPERRRFSLASDWPGAKSLLLPAVPHVSAVRLRSKGEARTGARLALST